MHAHIAAAFPYLYVAKISIRQPCLNFTIYSSHMLPCWLCQVDVLLLQLLALNAVGSYIQTQERSRKTLRQISYNSYAETNLGDEVECSVEISYAYTESESGCLTCLTVEWFPDYRQAEETLVMRSLHWD